MLTGSTKIEMLKKIVDEDVEKSRTAVLVQI